MAVRPPRSHSRLSGFLCFPKWQHQHQQTPSLAHPYVPQSGRPPEVFFLYHIITQCAHLWDGSTSRIRQNMFMDILYALEPVSSNASYEKPEPTSLISRLLSVFILAGRRCSRSAINFSAILSDLQASLARFWSGLSLKNIRFGIRYSLAWLETLSNTHPYCSDWWEGRADSISVRRK